MFQSTPGITAGRHDTQSVGTLAIRCFNPRPASLPGDTSSKVKVLAALDVSIHARHHCRATRAFAGQGNILTGFQSTPGITAGRHAIADGVGRIPAGFNPRPASLPGDTQLVGVPDPRLAGFNPRPASLPGDTAASPSISSAFPVSIHARHHCRATHRFRGAYGRFVQFQSTPGITAGRHRAFHAQARIAFEFQSTPGITAGRHFRHRRFGQGHDCFNPRPASLPGDTAAR